MEVKSLLPTELPKKPIAFTERRRSYHDQTPLALEGYVNIAYSTPDGKYLAAMTQSQIQIWSLLCNQKLFSYNVKGNFWLGLKSLNGTEDSKCILF